MIVSVIVFLGLASCFAHKEEPLFRPNPMSVGSPMTMVCSLNTILTSIYRHVTHIEELRLTKLADDTHASCTLDIALFPRAPVGGRIFASHGNSSDIQISYRGLNMYGQVNGKMGLVEDMGIKVVFQATTCLHRGAYRCQMWAFDMSQKERAIYPFQKVFYVDTLWQVPQLVSDDKNLFQLGSQVKVTCVGFGTIRNAILLFKIRIPGEEGYRTLPVDQSLFGEEGKSKIWMPTVSEQENATSGGPCGKEQYFIHTMSMSYQLKWEKLRNAEIICISEFQSRPLDMQRINHESFRAYWGARINLTMCANDKRARCTKMMFLDPYLFQEQPWTIQEAPKDTMPIVFLLIGISIGAVVLIYTSYTIIRSQQTNGVQTQRK